MLDRIINDYQLWTLVEEHAPQSPRAECYAQHSFRTLRNTLTLNEEHPLIAAGKGQVDEGFALMRNDRTFRRRLRRSYDSQGLGRLAEFGLQHPQFLRLVAKIKWLRNGGFDLLTPVRLRVAQP
jgi:hypothetical protein